MKFSLTRILLITILLVSPGFVFAQAQPVPTASAPTPTASSPTPTASSPIPTATNPGTTGALTNPLNATNFTQLLQEILTYVQQIGGIFLILMLIYTGFKFVEARGNEEKITSARTALLWTVVGGLLLLGASALAAAITATAQSL